jgi:hypothetical protein
MMKRAILRQLLVRKIGLSQLHFVLDLPHADSDAEAYSEEDDNNSGSTDYSSRRAPMNSNSVNHDHHGK